MKNVNTIIFYYDGKSKDVKEMIENAIDKGLEVHIVRIDN